MGTVFFVSSETKNARIGFDGPLVWSACVLISQTDRYWHVAPLAPETDSSLRAAQAVCLDNFKWFRKNSWCLIGRHPVLHDLEQF